MIDIIENVTDAAIANWLAARLGEALAGSQSEIAIAVPGGSTPFPILAELARHPLDFVRIIVWPSDDRMVPHDHPASNFGRIRALLSPVGARIMSLSVDAKPPHFGLVWVGMGTDGHVASLFPNTDPRPDDPMPVRRITPDPLPPEAPFDRLSLTLPALLATDRLMLVIRGADKRAMFDAAAADENDLPIARLMRGVRVPITCFA